MSLTVYYLKSEEPEKDFSGYRGALVQGRHAILVRKSEKNPPPRELIHQICYYRNTDGERDWLLDGEGDRLTRLHLKYLETSPHSEDEQQETIEEWLASKKRISELEKTIKLLYPTYLQTKKDFELELEQEQGKFREAAEAVLVAHGVDQVTIEGVEMYPMIQVTKTGEERLYLMRKGRRKERLEEVEEVEEVEVEEVEEVEGVEEVEVED